MGETIDPNYERVEFSPRAAVDLFEKRIRKILEHDPENNVHLPKGEINLHDFSDPGGKEFVRGFIEDDEGYEPDKDDPDGEAKLEEIREKRKDRIVNFAAKIRDEIDNDSEEE